MEDEINIPVKTQIIRGIPFPRSERFLEKNIVDAIENIPQEDDIIIASYPKTGTTWIQYIVLQIISKAQNFPTMDEASKKVVPFLELVGVGILDSASKPRTYKHHIPYHLVQKNEKSKYIYIYRRPEDTVVSYYKFIQSFDEENKINFEEFFDRFVLENIEYGSYFNHVLSYYQHKDEANLLLVSYEKLHKNTKEEVLRIAKFLGEDYYRSLIEDDEILNNILKNTSFDSMKNKLKLVIPVHETTGDCAGQTSTKDINFFRQGIVIGGKSFLTSIQKERLSNIVLNKMEGTSIAEEWLSQ